MSRRIFQTREQIDRVVSEYKKGESSMSIAKRYGCNYLAVLGTLRREGIKTRTPTAQKSLNHNYFETIDTEGKAYFLGLLMADGCVLDTKDRSMQLSIALQERDEHILRIFAKELEYQGDLLYENRQNNQKYYRSYYQNMYRLFASSNKLCADLIKLGCTPRKTYTLKWPRDVIPDHLMHHFIRGYMDGDGTVFTHTPAKGPIQYTVGFAGTPNFIGPLNDYIKKRLNIEGPSMRRSGGENSGRCTYFVSYAGNNRARMMFDYLYSDATIYLKRKKAKLEPVMSAPRFAAQFGPGGVRPKMTNE